MAKITVITPSIRPEALKVVSKCLRKQSFKDFEWLVGSPFTVNDQLSTHILDNFEGGFWTFNRACNEMIRQAEGELIVSWQDNIWGNSQVLEDFWSWYEKNPKVCVTGVGDQYQEVDKHLKPFIQVWGDPRKGSQDRFGSSYECYPSDWELNFCSAPRQAFLDVGGFDEALDYSGFGMDNISLSERIDESGYQFWIDHTIECRGLYHKRDHENWDANHNMHGPYEKRKKELKKIGLWPKLDFVL